MECYEEDVRGLVRFLADSPTAFHAVEGFATAHLACGATLTVALEWGNICPSDLYEGRRVWLHFAAASVEIEG